MLRFCTYLFPILLGERRKFSMISVSPSQELFHASHGLTELIKTVGTGL